MKPAIKVAVPGFAHYHANFWSEAFRDSPLAALGREVEIRY